MTTAAIYVRSSTVEPYGISIDNQLRSCRRAAATRGIVVDDKFVYRDNTPPGSSRTRPKRFAWNALIDAIAARTIDILYVEDIVRATRYMDECTELMSIVEACGLRVVTCDGLDTALSDWKTKWLAQLMASEANSKWTSIKTARGLLGKLERGYQVSVAPFGFKRVREQTRYGSELGTTWKIEPDKAELIRDMYSLRQSGKSYSKIAQYLNDSNVAPPRPHHCLGLARWRASNVRSVLVNKIYRGVYVWNGSARAQKASVKEGRELDVREFERPQLRIVSDETWAVCNRPKVSVEANTDEA